VTDWRTTVIAVRLQRDEPDGSGPGMPAFPRAGARATLVSVPENHNRGEPGPPGAEDGQGPASQGGEGARILEALSALHKRLGELERLVGPAGRAAPDGAQKAIPAWKRVTPGEPRWQVAIATAVAIALQFPLPGRLVLLRPDWLLPVLQALLFAGLVVVSPRRINRESRAIRALSLTLAGVLSLANAWSAGRLVAGLAHGTEGTAAGPLLVSGGAIWLTNVIVFALWYWEFDRAGPVARANATRRYPDFQFAQMANPELAPPHWEPAFGDYLYLSFTNAAAFSPTDVMPLSRWAKTAMLLQSAVSIVTVVLVIARAVNILR